MVVETNLQLNAEEAARDEVNAVLAVTEEAKKQSKKQSNSKRRNRARRKSSSPLVMKVHKGSSKNPLGASLETASTKGDENNAENEETMSVGSAALSEMSMAESIMGPFGKHLDYDDEDIQIKVVMKGSKIKKVLKKLEKQKKLNLELCENMSTLEERLDQEKRLTEKLGLEKSDLQQSQSVLEQTRARLETEVSNLQQQLKQTTTEKHGLLKDLSDCRVDLAQTTTQLQSAREQLERSQLSCDKLSADLDAADTEILQTRKAKNKQDEELRRLREDVERANRQNEELNAKLRDSLANAEALGKEAERHLQRGDTLADAKRALERNLEAQNASATSLRLEADTLTATLHQLRKEGGEMKRSNSHLTDSVIELKEDGKVKQAKIDSLIAESGALKERVTKLENQRTELKSKYVDVKKQLKEVNERERHAVQTAQHFQHQLKESQGQAEVLHRGLTRAQSQVDAHEGHIAETSAELSGLRTQNEDLRNEVETMHAENAELNAEVTELEQAATRLKQELENVKKSSAEADSQIKRLKRSNASFTAKDKRRVAQLEQLKSENLNIKKSQAKQLVKQKKMLKAAAPDLSVPIVGLGADMHSFMSGSQRSMSGSEGRVSELHMIQRKLDRIAATARVDCDDLKKLVQHLHTTIEDHRHLWDTSKTGLSVPGVRTLESPSLSPLDLSMENTPDSIRGQPVNPN